MPRTSPSGLLSRGTESSQTPRWREVDSNFRFRARLPGCFAPQIAYAFCVRAATPTVGKSMCTGAELRRPLRADRSRGTAMLPLQGHQRSTCRSPDANARCRPITDARRHPRTCLAASGENTRPGIAPQRSPRVPVGTHPAFRPHQDPHLLAVIRRDRSIHREHHGLPAQLPGGLIPARLTATAEQEARAAELWPRPRWGRRYENGDAAAQRFGSQRALR
jgi:hypothetical protein